MSEVPGREGVTGGRAGRSRAPGQLPASNKLYRRRWLSLPPIIAMLIATNCSLSCPPTHPPTPMGRIGLGVQRNRKRPRLHDC